MIPENLSHAELLKQLKFTLTQIFADFKTLKCGEWYRTDFNPYNIIVFDDNNLAYHFSYLDAHKYMKVKEIEC